MMEKVEVTWGNTLKVWWSYIWRCTVFSLISAAILAFLGGFVVGTMGKAELGGIVGSILGFIAYILVSIWVLKKILGKKYKEFSVALIKEVESEQGTVILKSNT